MVGTYILFFSEKWNRRPTLYISAVLMACCFIIVNVVNKTTPAPTNHQVTSAGIATVAMVFITNSIYQFSWGPLPWPYAAEVSSVHLISVVQQLTVPRSSRPGSVKLARQSASRRSGCSTSCSRLPRLT